MAPVAEHRDQAEVGEQLHRREEAGPDASGAHRLAEDVVGLLREPAGLHALGAEPLHHSHPRDRLLDDGGELGGLAPGCPSPRGGVGGRSACAAMLRNGRLPSASSVSSGSIVEQDDGDGEHRDGVGDRQRDHHDERLDLLEVGVGAAHELTGLRVVVEAEVELLDVREEPVAQVSLDPARLPEGEVPPQPGEDGRDRSRRHRSAATSRAARTSSPLSMPLSTAPLTRSPLLTLPTVHISPTLTPAAMPQRRGHMAWRISFQPAPVLLISASVPSSIGLPLP